MILPLIFMGYYICLTLIYSIIIVMLNIVMRKMAGNFRKEIRSVNCQFVFFFLAYLTRTLAIIFGYALRRDQHHNNDLELADIILNTVKYFFMWQLPTFMILLMHYKAFNPRTLKKNYVFDHIDNEESNLLEVSDNDIASVNQEISNPMETVN